MFTKILFIMVAWLVVMPQWLSILITVICGLGIIADIVKFSIEASKD